MKKLLFLTLTTLLGFGLLAAQAQSVTSIFSFTNSASPCASLTLGLDGNFYGTTSAGGTYGSVFRVTTNGNLTTLATSFFTTGDDILAGVTFGPDGNLYGAAELGGSTADGTLFRVTTNGSFTMLVDFNYEDGANLGYGAYPVSSLTLGPDGNFYGTTEGGGTSGKGTLFKVTTNGSLTTLVYFSGANGTGPDAALTLGPDGNFYGTTDQGGSGNYGTVFKVSTNGGLTTLVSFANTNGASPLANLTLGPDGNFYGTTAGGGGSGYGTVFKVSTNGGLTTLVGFTNTNGAYPYASLTLGPDGNFYGTTAGGGGSGYGTVFKVSTNGGLTTLVSFTNTNGAHPDASLTLGPDGNFYGTTQDGGSNNVGTIYRLNLPPDLSVVGTNQLVFQGSSAVVTLTPFGTPPFTYQWLCNNVVIASGTSSNFTIPNATPTTLSNYQVIITNAYGSFTCSGAALNMLFHQPSSYAIVNNGNGGQTIFLGSYPNSTNRLWAATNFGLPRAQWQIIATNVMNANGLGQYLDTNTAGVPSKYYRLSLP